MQSMELKGLLNLNYITWNSYEKAKSSLVRALSEKATMMLIILTSIASTLPIEASDSFHFIWELSPFLPPALQSRRPRRTSTSPTLHLTKHFPYHRVLKVMEYKVWAHPTANIKSIYKDHYKSFPSASIMHIRCSLSTWKSIIPIAKRFYYIKMKYEVLFLSPYTPGKKFH